MSAPTLAPEPVGSRDTPDDETHVVCCNTEIALCGSDVAGTPWVGQGQETTCVVCRDLEGKPCPRCGL